MAGNNYYGFTHGGSQFSAGIGNSSGSSAYAGAFTSSQSAYVSGQTAYSAVGGRTQTGYQDAQYGASTGRAQSLSPTSYGESSDMYFGGSGGTSSYNPSSVTDARSGSQYQYQSSPVDERPDYLSTSGITSPFAGSRLSHLDWQSSGGSSVGKTHSGERGFGVSSSSQAMQSNYSALRSDYGTTLSAHNSAPISAAPAQVIPTIYASNAAFAHKKSGFESVSGGGGSFWQRKPFHPVVHRPVRQSPKQSQLHYCEVCKISCAGTPTFKEHLDGKNHKKKEAMAKTLSGTAVLARQNRQFFCELCDVACTNADTYTAHLRGVKHQKVVTLHQKLGKPIPEPIKIEDMSSVPTGSKKNGGKLLKPLDEGSPEETGDNSAAGEDNDVDGSEEIQSVGIEYIEEGCNDAGTAASFHCKLCNCHFTDPQAKLMHSKGRRHRQNYKEKVDPTLVVDVKAPKINPYARRAQIDRLKRHMANGDYWHKRRLEEVYRLEVEELRYEQEMLRWQLSQASGVSPARASGNRGSAASNWDPENDRCITAKHGSIYPNKKDLDAVQLMVSSCEKALKLVSDNLAKKSGGVETIKTEPDIADQPEVNESETDSESKVQVKSLLESSSSSDVQRQLKGVMRVGSLAKGLLLHGDLDLHLILLCRDRPTTALLRTVYESLPEQFASISQDQYVITLSENGDAIIVTQDQEPKVTCTISLTSPAVKDESSLAENKDDLIDRDKCLELLAALRRTKWFQATVSKMQPGLMLIRILRDICHRIPTWQPLGQWAMELIVERCLSSAYGTLSPELGLRRVFECIASGLLLPGGPGLVDPCEKEAIDVLTVLTQQQLEDITISAQKALRWIAFGQMHRVLGSEPLPSLSVSPGLRKRPLNDEATGTYQLLKDGSIWLFVYVLVRSTAEALLDKQWHIQQSPSPVSSSRILCLPPTVAAADDLEFIKCATISRAVSFLNTTKS